MATNDVVRHVILRILVDQAGLAEQLAAAREKLKALKSSEGEINKERGKSADDVTDKLRKQNEVLGENAKAHEANRRARTTTGQSKAQQVAAETSEIQKNTKATEAQTVAEAKAAAIRQDAARKDRESAEKLKQQRAAGTQQRTEATAFGKQQRTEATEFGKQQRTEATSFGQSQRAINEANAEAERIRKGAESQAAVTRKDAESTANATRKDTTAADEQIRKDKAAAAAQINKDRESAARVANQAAESEARKASSAARTSGVEAKNADAGDIADSTRDVRRQAVTDRATSQSSVAQSTASAAQSREEAAATSALTAEERKLTAETTRQNQELAQQETIRQRRIQTTRQVKALENDITKASQQGELLEQRIAAASEARARAAERTATAKRRQATILGSIGDVVSDVAVAGARSVSSAIPGSARRAATTRDNTSDLDEIERKATTVSGRVEKLFGDLGKKISRNVSSGAEDAAAQLGKLTQRVRGYIDSINRPRAGGSGDSLFKDLLGNLSALGNKLSGTLQSGTQHLISFQSLVIAVIAALGPLSAILGAVGAAALALASDIGALVGGFAALPGLIGAALAGFGALAIVMKPLSGIFSAYSAARKEATTTTNAAKDALNDYRIAQITAQQAEIDWKRAQADAPRAVQALADARKDATRQIEDYRTALKRLKFDEEGSTEGVLSAEQAARRAMADPTANNLDRRIALHNVQGALFDQQDQATNAQRTRQDASEAFKKGVDGSDAVIAANREVEDSARKIDLAYLQWQKDLLATKKAASASDAGGTAAAELAAQMAKLPPQTRKVAQAILDLINGPYKKMRDQLSENIFGPISGETGKFKDVLSELATFLTPASKAIGILAKNALDLLTNPDWKDFFSQQGAEAGKIIGTLGEAALDAANGFKDIIIVSQPFTRFVVDGILGMAKAFERFATSSDGRLKVVQFLDNTQKRMSELAPVLVNFAKGIAGFFRALNTPSGGQKDFTTWFNEGLLKASQTFERLGKQAGDPQGGFQKWLHDVRPLLHDIVGFIDAAAKFAGRLFSDNRNINEARDTLKTISTQWLPQLAEIFGKLSQSGLVSKLAAAIGAVFSGLNTFFDHGGLTTLSVFASTLEIAGQGLGTVAGWIDKLLTAFPVLNGVAKVLGSTLALIFGVALVAKLSGVIGLVTNLIKASKGIGNIVRSVRDPDPEATGSAGKSRLTRLRQGAVDTVKDRVLPGRDTGESAARRRTREQVKANTGTGSSSSRIRTGARTTAPTVDLTGTGGVIPHLSRMEVLLQRIAANTGRLSSGGSGGGSGGEGERTGSGGGKPRPSGGGGGLTMPPGVDPNSEEGIAYRNAAEGKLDTGDAARLSTPATTRYTAPQDPATYKAPRAGAKRQTIPGLQDAYTVPLPAQSRDARGRLLPREPLEDNRGFDPYTNIAGAPQASRRSRVKGRARKVGKGLLGGLGTIGSALGAPFTGGNDTGAIGTGSLLSRKGGRADVEFDEGYTEGYDDALSQLGGGQQGSNLPDRSREKDKLGKKGRSTPEEERNLARRGTKAAESEVEEVAEGAGKKGGLLSRLLGRGKVGTIASVAEEGVEVAEGAGKKGSLLSRLFGGGKAGKVAGVAEEGVEDVVKSGIGGKLGRVGLGLAKGAAGGIGGIVAGAAASLGGDYLIDKFVKNDKDKGSLQRGLGAVAQGAGLGATIGSFVPGVGTVIGGAVGGLVGGAYSLIKDKNLRNFVGGKIEGGAKAVGGFVSGAAKGVGNFVGDLFGGGDDKDKAGGKPGGVKGFLSGIKNEATSGLGGAAATLLGPVGLLLGKTDIGKAIIDSLNKAGGKIGAFFTKTIPDAFHKGVKGIETFFTKTLPALPGKFFDAFFVGVGRIIRFFLHDLPDASKWLFTKAIPAAASAAWGFIVHDLWNPFLSFVEAIPGFFTKTIPHWFETAQSWYKKHVTVPVLNFITKTIPEFFTVTIPKWFQEAPHWFKTHVIDNVTKFFTVTLPQFFTVTLPNAIAGLPGFLYNHLVQPILDFFGGLKDHVTDFLKGSWDWAKGLFSRAGKDIDKGEQGKMSGGMITGVFRGIEDTERLRATPGEMVIRRAKAQEPGAKMFLQDFNERGMASLYQGLSATTAPQVMAMVPPDAAQLTNRVPMVVNNTVNHAPLMGDVTIHNPIREKSEATLRRQIHIAAIRHRR